MILSPLLREALRYAALAVRNSRSRSSGVVQSWTRAGNGVRKPEKFREEGPVEVRRGRAKFFDCPSVVIHNLQFSNSTTNVA